MSIFAVIAYLAGLTSANDWPYLLWSGVIGDATLAGAAWSIIRRHNCEVHGCWRVGKHQTAAGHCVCRKHHPDDHLTADDVLTAHNAARADIA